MKDTPATNIIEEYFDDVEQDSTLQASKQIFSADDDDVDIKTDLSISEIYYLNAMIMYDEVLNHYGIGEIFSSFYKPYFRLKISKDRQSRGEFVKISSQDKSEDVVNTIKSAGSIMGDKK